MISVDWSLTYLEQNEVVQTMIRQMNDEVKQNFDLCQKTYGTPVRFNQIIQLLHVQSQKFLTYFPKSSSKYEPDNLAVELGDEYSDNTKFRLLSVYNFQQGNQGRLVAP